MHSHTFEMYTQSRKNFTVRAIRAFHQTKKIIRFRFQLRKDSLVRKFGVMNEEEDEGRERTHAGTMAYIEYPSDITFEEAKRMAALILTLPFDHENMEERRRLVDHLLGKVRN